MDWKIKEEGERAGEEEPEVFTVHPTAGFIAGRGLGQPQKQKIQVTCAPRGGGMLCEKRLLFSTRKGKDNAVALRGEGPGARCWSPSWRSRCTKTITCTT